MKVKFSDGRNSYEVGQTLLDKVVTHFSPERGLARLKSRMHMAVAGGYTGGSRSKSSLKNWTPVGMDADSSILPDLDDLRSRSRSLIRNSPLACGAANTMCTSVVGPGLKLKAEVNSDYLGMTDEQAAAWEKDAEFLYNAWAGSRDCDITRIQNMAEMQNTIFRSVFENGDVFTVLPNKKFRGSPFSLKVQMIEADRVTNKDFSQDTVTLAGGIKFTDQGTPIEYYVLKTHPGATYRESREWTAIPAYGSRTGRKNILHHYKKLRVGQSRGVPSLAPVIEAFKQLERYTEAELASAVVSSMFTVFLSTDSHSNGLDVFDGSGDSRSDDDYKLAPGAIVQLRDGDNIDIANPGRPNPAFDPFVMAVVRQIGVALEIPYEIMVKHFTASYSASQAAMLEAWRFFSTCREWLASSFCQPVYEAFIDEQVMEGRLIAPGYFSDPLIRKAYLGAKWIGRPRGQIDSLKENKADVIAEDRGWKTAEQNTIEKTGGDWEKNHKQRTKEVAMRMADGVDGMAVEDEEPKKEDEVDDETT